MCPAVSEGEAWYKQQPPQLKPSLTCNQLLITTCSLISPEIYQEDQITHFLTKNIK
jgi:hypothetical protein